MDCWQSGGALACRQIITVAAMELPAEMLCPRLQVPLQKPDGVLSENKLAQTISRPRPLDIHLFLQGIRRPLRNDSVSIRKR